MQTLHLLCEKGQLHLVIKHKFSFLEKLTIIYRTAKILKCVCTPQLKVFETYLPVTNNFDDAGPAKPGADAIQCS